MNYRTMLILCGITTLLLCAAAVAIYVHAFQVVLR
jgi:hypothetical protein